MTEVQLYIVSTPIGNMEDITYRAVRILKEVDLIAAEDTRKTQNLLSRYSIDTKTTSYHSFNVRQKTPSLIKMLNEGKTMALVSDAGTPGISDPGEVLVKEAIKQGINITAIPGPAAMIAALVISGKQTNSFVFEGFLSNKSGRRKRQLEKLLLEDRTIILYESPHRIVKLLAEFDRCAPGREVVLGRELTKKFEEIRRGTAKEHVCHFEATKPKGEFVVIF
jgi:16S rRNA (cytidine1402-2'-O)-methyltransferase